MEQTTQQTIQKPSLPIKTKIVAILMGLISGIILLFTPLLTIGYFLAEYSISLFGVVVFLITLLPFLASIFLLRKKRWAWMLTVIILSVGLVASILEIVFALGDINIYINIFEELYTPQEVRFKYVLLFSTLLIFLLLDRKNFWKIAT